MVLAGGINRIYVEYIQTFLHVWQCQNGYAFPGGLEVASDPKASPIEQEKNMTKYSAVSFATWVSQYPLFHNQYCVYHSVKRITRSQTRSPIHRSQGQGMPSS